MTKPIYVLVLDAHPVEDGRIQKHIRFLLDKDYRVYHIHVIPYINNPEIADGEYSLFGERSWHLNLHWKIKIPGLRLLNFLSLFSPSLIRKATKIIRVFPISPDEDGIIHVHDPILLPLAAKIQNRWLTQARIVYDRHEVYQDMKRFAGFGGYRIFEQVAGNVISGVITVSERHNSTTSQLFPGAPISTVPNFPMIAFVNQDTVQKKIASFSESTPISCIYIGSLRNDLDRDIDLLLEIADTVLSEIPNSQFVIGGHCTDASIMKKIERTFPRP